MKNENVTRNFQEFVAEWQEIAEDKELYEAVAEGPLRRVKMYRAIAMAVTAVLAVGGLLLLQHAPILSIFLFLIAAVSTKLAKGIEMYIRYKNGGRLNSGVNVHKKNKGKEVMEVNRFYADNPQKHQRFVADLWKYADSYDIAPLSGIARMMADASGNFPEISVERLREGDADDYRILFFGVHPEHPQVPQLFWTQGDGIFKAGKDAMF